MRALVVDDSKAMRRILTSMIVHEGYTVHEAENGKSALAKLEETGPVELMLIDWNMPEMSGIELVRELRTRPQFADSRLMMVTSETDLERIVQALEAGANEYVMKPVTPEALREKLQILGLAPQ